MMFGVANDAGEASPDTAARRDSVPSNGSWETVGEERVCDLYTLGSAVDYVLDRISDYRRGGHHPVHLNDLLGDRYKVVHKLGCGGFATVWLCRDVRYLYPRYVAVKIIVADQKPKKCPEAKANLAALGLDRASDNCKYLALPLNQFEIHGPNGTHLALVFPVLGPLARQPWHLIDQPDYQVHLQRICRQVVSAMAELHSRGVCHGDFRPENILLGVSGLDGHSEEEVLSLLGMPQTTTVLSLSTWFHSDPTKPQYLVHPIDWSRVAESGAGRKLLTGDVKVIDFGAAYAAERPPKRLTIPPLWTDPHNLVGEDRELGKASDLWALGCTLFEIRTGQHPFCDEFTDAIRPEELSDANETLAEINLVFGKLPPHLWTRWTDRDIYFTEEVKTDGRPVLTSSAATRKWSGRSIVDKLRWGVKFTTEECQFTGPIGKYEATVFADLLGKILVYHPEERLPAKDILDHDWFKLDFGQVE